MTLSELHQLLFPDVFRVYRVFQDFFGADFTDLQGLPTSYRAAGIISNPRGDYELADTSEDALHTIQAAYTGTRPFILVWWPQVTVTNESNRSVLIQDLYAKVVLNTDGCIPYEEHGFLLNRATYSALQFSSNYMHSHICDIPKGHFQDFQRPCLGRGPIVHTILTLKSTSDDTSWMLFCQELSLYVTVESVRGVPYHYLERLGNTSQNRVYASDYRQLKAPPSSWFYLTDIISPQGWKDFISYYLQHGHLTLGYYNQTFHTTMSLFDYIIDVSNSFIDYFNSIPAFYPFADQLLSRHVLEEVFAANGKLYKQVNSGPILIDRLRSQYEGSSICTFKGHDITLTLLDSPSNDEQPLPTLVLNYELAMYIITKILQTINFHYHNDTNHQQPDTNQNLSPAPSIGETIIYI